MAGFPCALTGIGPQAAHSLSIQPAGKKSIHPIGPILSFKVASSQADFFVKQGFLRFYLQKTRIFYSKKKKVQDKI